MLVLLIQDLRNVKSCIKSTRTKSSRGEEKSVLALLIQDLRNVESCIRSAGTTFGVKL